MKTPTKKVHLYHCDNEKCGRPITATAGDAVYKVGPRTLCAECHNGAKTARVATPTSTTTKADGRGAAAKARWDAMSPEAKLAKMAKMRAARAPRGQVEA